MIIIKDDYGKDYKVSDKEFKILHISSCFPRKGVDVLLKAYLKTFKKKF